MRCFESCPRMGTTQHRIECTVSKITHSAGKGSNHSMKTCILTVIHIRACDTRMWRPWCRPSSETPRSPGTGLPNVSGALNTNTRVSELANKQDEKGRTGVGPLIDRP